MFFDIMSLCEQQAGIKNDLGERDGDRASLKLNSPNRRNLQHYYILTLMEQEENFLQYTSNILATFNVI